MKAVRRIAGRAVPLDRRDVDTDQIIPSDWLKRIGRGGFGEGLFSAWRRDPAFVLNDPRYAGATVLLAGANFGCGSSREHAAWALEDAGFAVVVAPSFADIFRTNCASIGLVTVELGEADVAALMRAVERDPRTELVVDVAARTIAGAGIARAFPLDDLTRTRLLEGLDDIGLSLREEDAIAAYERSRPPWRPALATR
ncbi:MAG TPA: 3-isopropylmalate dehydratase small subunit [Candidatus Limnocylindria bacterium]|nr:3-isopropylmalate dehydratase small subunit [Candidatus Limnocylindria bacterium]